MPTTIWKGHLSFGLVTIPVKLYRAARAEKVSFHQLYRAPADVEGPAPEPTRAPVTRPVRGRKEAVLPEPPPAAAFQARQEPQPEAEPPLTRIRQAAYVPEADTGTQT